VAKNVLEFSVNERVNHPIYSLGTISRIDEQHTVIEFDQAGRKKFVTSLLQIEHSDATAPVKKRTVRKPKAKK